MIALVQRVKNSYVEIDGKKVSQIQIGLNVLLCVTQNDSIEDISYLADKIVRLRIFSDDNDKMNLSVQDVKGEMLVISQFTLAADTKRGNRPSFSNAADADIARNYYGLFVDYIRDKYKMIVKTGEFAANMIVNIVNDGPVTIIIDSHENRKKV